MREFATLCVVCLVSIGNFCDFVCSLWNVESGDCLRILKGHEDLVRCLRFDSKRIVSGAYDGKIKIWDLVAALDPRTPASALCLQTLEVCHIWFLSFLVERWNTQRF